MGSQNVEMSDEQFGPGAKGFAGEAEKEDLRAKMQLGKMMSNRNVQHSPPNHRTSPPSQINVSRLSPK